MKSWRLAVTSMFLMSAVIDFARAAGTTVLPAATIRPAAFPNASPLHYQISGSFFLNRARVLGARASASRTRYFAVTEETMRASGRQIGALQLDLRGMSPAETPRTVEVIIRLRHPIVLRSQMDARAGIGSVSLDRSVRNLSVYTVIDGVQLTTIGRRPW